KVGDLAHYSVTIVNTGQSALYPQSISDTLAGAIPASAFTESGANNDVLDVGETWTYGYALTVPSGAADPYLNTVTAAFATQWGVALTGSASHTVDLFQPAIDVSETGDTLSKVGDSVNYTITVRNDSSANTPAMLFDVSDAALGIDLRGVAIANGASLVIPVRGFVIPAGATDPFVNAVSVHASVA